MAESVALLTGQTIGKLLIDEAKFLWALKGKVEELQRELELIQGLLRDADTRQQSEQAVASVAQLRDIAYDAEDVIERYNLRVAPMKEQYITKAYASFVAKCPCVQAHVVGTTIDGLKSSISNLRSSMLAYGGQMVNEAERKRTRTLMPKRTYAHFEEHFVGREDSLTVLVKELLKDEEGHGFVFIWGMGGLGKTTLAKKVFAHEKVKKHFDGCAWACVSQEYHPRNILRGIFVKLIPDNKQGVTQMRDEELFETLYKIQQEKRCIVVLDDIWTKEAWDSLKDAFPVENTKSKLLITTRNKEVAKYIDPHGCFHELRCLSDQESRELLMKRMFPEMKTVGLSAVGPEVGQGIIAGQPEEGIARQSELEGQMPDMKRLGDELLKKCGGLPLAINMLGGLLAVKGWETVPQNINLHFTDESDVTPVLALSYDDLPWHLKSCFLYFGSFPIDQPIPKKKVLHMWIAEGFVSSNTYDRRGEISMEDVAEHYLMELVNRGMVQVRFSSSGKIKTCHLHDLMRDLCIKKAKKEGFLTILEEDEMEKCPSFEKEVKPTCKIRRLSLDIQAGFKGNTIPIVEQKQTTMLHLRTLMFFNSKKSLIGMWEHFQPIFIYCKFLRILKLEGFHDMRGNLPKSVGDLVHLRHLSLAGSMLNDLPQSMGNLVCMEYLDLHGLEFSRVIVPNVLWKMRSLRHLHLPSYFDLNGPKKLQLDSLENLQTLRNFSLECCNVNDLSKLINLRKLTIPLLHGSDKLNIMPLLATFDLKHLQSSSFGFSNQGRSFTKDKLSEMSSYPYSCKLVIRGAIEKLPEDKNLPQQLRKLTLLDSQLKEDPMPILEKLQHLVVLLMNNSFVGKEMTCSAKGFPQLKNLLLQGLRNLEAWRVTEGAMPRLSRVEIGYCSKLKKSAHMTVLEMFSSNGSIVTWEEETEESNEKILGVPLEERKGRRRRRKPEIYCPSPLEDLSAKEQEEEKTRHLMRENFSNEIFIS